MNEGRVERRLTAILAADVAGYSRLIGEDEEGTLAALRVMRREVIDPATAEHHGRLVKTTGDGLLAEFGSVVDAVRCATAWQAGVPADSAIAWRIGIHQGDIVVEDGDIFGDGVNVAARLEALAEPGGICLSARVQEDVLGKLELTFVDLGEQQLKNIARPVRVYRVHAADHPVSNRPLLATGQEGAEEVRAAPTSISQPLSAAPRLSIVVLPFANLGSDPEQQYFADGITEDLTTDLSRISGSFVIARNTAFTYEGKAIDLKQIGRELGVRYVLEGSVRRSGDRVRVNAQLVDAETGAHLRAERFNRTVSDLLEIQDDITLCIASELNVELVEAESKRAIREHPNNLDAIDLTMQARALSNKPTSPEQIAQVRELYEKALSIDPENVDALIGLAHGYIVGMSDFHLFGEHDDEWKRRATDAISRALAIEPRNARAILDKSRLLARLTERDWRGELDEAIDAAEAALALDPNLARAYGWLGRLYAKAGHPERTAASVQQAMRLSPRDPITADWLYEIGIAQLQMGQYDEAIATFRKSLVANPNLGISRENLSAAYLGSGREAEARSVLADIRRQAAPGMPDQLDEHLLLMRVQLMLLQQGFWPYGVHGRYPRFTAQALRAFQRKENLPETGSPDEVTLARLGVAKASVE